MRLDCADIIKITDSDFECQFDEQAFLDHMNTCQACANLFELRPEIEDRLANLLPHAAPLSFTDDLLLAIPNEKQSIIEMAFIRMRRPLAAAFSLLIISILLLNRKVFEQVASIISPRAINSDLISSIIPIDMLMNGLRGAVPVLTSPIVFLALTAGITLIWAFCIFKFRETIK